MKPSLILSAIKAPTTEGLMLRLSLLGLLALLLLAIVPGGKEPLFISLNSALVFSGSEPFWSGITLFADTWLTLGLMLPVLLLKPRMAGVLFFAALMATLITHSIKPLLDLPRPPAVLPENSFNLIGSSISSKSFPSGHTVSAFVFAGLLLYAFGLRGWLAALVIGFAAIMGLSRLAVGVHWPADLVAGAMIGLTSVLMTVWLIKRYPKLTSGRAWQPIGVLITGGCAFSAPWASLGYPEGAWAAWFVFVLASVCLLAIIFWYFTRTNPIKYGQYGKEKGNSREKH